MATYFHLNKLEKQKVLSVVLVTIEKKKLLCHLVYLGFKRGFSLLFKIFLIGGTMILIRVFV